ncbi:transmembrane protein 53 [Seminavis robusta]|uniref:Transmembrane protein 53 n=1 Tax=Seminavis robusta TaxID=568900 RepID=A0A9N8I1M4_9STRA|nr:transmembrane protein 53 [Seminavis robusta]|eukprot:Sro3911_g351850.1 transmembrane protein 53 (278) ;mRNA; r:823-1656
MPKSSKPKLVVEAPPNGQQPKAVVILLGWFGAQFRHLKKYADLYEQFGCTTISAILDKKSIMFINLVKTDALVNMVVKEACRHLRQGGDEVPLICHAFSNGGCVPLYRMQKQMMEKINSNNAEDVDNWKLIRDRYQLGAEIIDSAPIFPDAAAFGRAIRTALPNRVLSSTAIFFVSIYQNSQNSVMKARGKKPYPDKFWSHWEDSPQYAGVQAFIYTTADTILPYEKLDELVETRKAHEGANVLVERFGDSDHVQLLKDHKEEYCSLIGRVLDGSKK